MKVRDPNQILSDNCPLIRTRDQLSRALDRSVRKCFGAGTTLRNAVVASALWLPLYEAVDRNDSTFRRSVKGTGTEPRLLAEQCARLMGPDARLVLEWMRRAPLEGGLAAELVDAEGRAVGNGGDAALAGLLAYTVWYAVHALGVRP